MTEAQIEDRRKILELWMQSVRRTVSLDCGNDLSAIRLLARSAQHRQRHVANTFGRTVPSQVATNPDISGGDDWKKFMMLAPDYAEVGVSAVRWSCLVAWRVKLMPSTVL